MPVYNLLVPSADKLGTDALPAPAAQVWKGVAMLLSQGIEALPASARWGILVAGIIGVILALLEYYVPKAGRYLPSAAGFGMAFVIPFFNSFSMFIGAVIAWIIYERARDKARMYTIPVSSGFIAGESLMGHRDRCAGHAGNNKIIALFCGNRLCMRRREHRTVKRRGLGRGRERGQRKGTRRRR